MRCVPALLLATLPLLPQAAEKPRFELSGFGTLGLAYNSTDQAQFIRDVSQPKGPHATVDAGVDSRLGLQANLHLSESFELVAQGVSSRRFDDTFKPELTWAFLKYRAGDTVELRGGRLGFDVYPLADSRNVGYSYLWVRPPVEFFGAIPITSFDGGDVVLHRAFGSAFGSLKLFGGQAAGRIPAGGDQVFDLKGSPLAGLSADLRTGDWWMRAAFAEMRFKHEYNRDVDALLAALRDPAVAALDPSTPALADDLALTEKWARYLSLSLGLERGGWTSQLGLSRISSQSLSLPTAYAGYFLVGRRWGAWTPYLNLAAVKSRSESRHTALPQVPPFDAVNDGVARLFDLNQNRQRSVSTGLRWDLHRHFCLKAQVDAIRNVDGSTQLWWRADPAWNGHATVATLGLDFVF